MHDGIELEKLHTPTVVVCTDLFDVTARQLATLRGAPEFPLTLIPHPLGRCSHSDLRKEAERVVGEIVEKLTSSSASNREAGF